MLYQSLTESRLIEYYFDNSLAAKHVRGVKMKVYIEKDDRSLDIKVSKTEKITGKQLLEELRINPSTVILVKDNEVILDDEVLENNNEIKILSVVSGG